MHYTIYQIVNKIDGKIYIGKHQTKDLNDGYMGSGKHLRRAIEKYGIENFEKKILHTLDSEAAMNAKEAELVTEEFCSREDTYNICPGGHGGWGYINQNSLQHTTEVRKKANESRSKNLDWVENTTRRCVENNLKYNADRWKRAMKVLTEKYPNGTMYGKSHTEDTKLKMSLSASGKSNSQYGTMWITNGSENKKIKKDLDIIPDGWYKGRRK